MINVEGLTRRYGDFLAVDNVSFQIQQGEIIGLLGHNGAGKTTLMKMLTGYLEADSGRIEIDGLDMAKQRCAMQQKMGYLPENCPVYPDMVVVDYLRYCARLYGVTAQAIDEAVKRAIQRTALEAKATALISTLSRGLRQRVGVAQAILTEPDILILDEPTNGLDPSQIHHMRDLIKTLAEHATVIVSTHILQEVQAVCDRVIIMRSGRVVLDSTLAAIQESRRLIVDVNADIVQLASMRGAVDGVIDVALIADGPAYQSYALTLNEEKSMHDVTPVVANYIQQQGWLLYGLYPDKQNLESVFGTLNAPSLNPSEVQP